MREYIWLPEAEIAPTAASRATIDRPIAVVDGVNATPDTYYVHADHLHRPIRMTNAAKSIVWSAEYQPWGAVQSLSGALTLDLRFPGQWFQLEAGLHYNWHRHYDASLGRYTQPDPLGFVDGPSVYGYAGGSPLIAADPDGQVRKLPPNRVQRRDCNALEYAKCSKQCGSRGVESCKVSQNWVVLRTKGEKTVWGWKDAGFSCSCNPDPDPTPSTPVPSTPNSCSNKNCRNVLRAVRDVFTGVVIFTVVVICEAVL